MLQLHVVTRAGEKKTLEGKPGVTVMEIIRDGVGDVLALCGGCCSCATCHVYVDPVVLERLPQMSEEEDALLDSSDYRTAGSRLSCQLPFTESLSGSTFVIAPED